MVVYEVNLGVDADAAEAYAAWLGPHIESILRLDGLVGADWCTVDDEGGDGRVRWCIQYRLRDRAVLDAYLRDHAPAFRAEGLARFGGRFDASRRVLTRRTAFGPDERA